MYYGVPYNPDTAIRKYWLQAFRLGDIANLGPAVRPEEDGAPYGEEGNRVQFFANGVVVSKPEEGWKCYRRMAVREPERWRLR